MQKLKEKKTEEKIEKKLINNLEGGRHYQC